MPKPPGSVPPCAAPRFPARGIALWFLGGLSAWSAAWLLVGAGPLLHLYRNPHPWLSSNFTPPVFVQALVEWMRATLSAYLAVGLVSTALALPALRLCGGRPYRRGVALGLALALWLHGILYVQVPVALFSLPGLRFLPIGLLLLGFLGGGGALGWRALAPGPARGRAKVLVPLLAVLALLPFLPHDLLRGRRSGGLLPATRPRLILVSFDALRRDTLERAMPAWTRPGTEQTITVFPATRLAWETILGADPDRTFQTTLAPPLWDVTHPEHLALLAQARGAHLRTAFAIDDSLSPCYGLQPTLFDTVREPAGGWKYWLSYGEGTTWPVYAWLQNLTAPIETSNPWNDTSAWFRDLGRLLAGHDWVSSHNCQLHPPLRLTLAELQAFDPWRWPLHPPLAYISYDGIRDQEEDSGHWQETWRSDGKRQYEVRAARLLKATVPILAAWSRLYPGLSGVLLADHGEGFPVFLGDPRTPGTHGSGLHGFGLDALSLAIPLHPFGATRDLLAAGQVWSNLDLRDAIGAWIRDRRPLALEGNAKGWLVQIHTIVPTHLSRDPQDAARGLRPEDIARQIHLFPNGSWYQDAIDARVSAAIPVSSALVTSGAMVLINPLGAGRYFRQEILAGAAQPGRAITLEEYRTELQAFPGRRAVPGALP